MKIWDAHCDVLYKLWKYPKERFSKSRYLQIDYDSLVKTDVAVLCMTIYVPPTCKDPWLAVLNQISIFHNQILSKPNIVFLKNRDEINKLSNNEIGVFLNLEGLHSIEGDITRLIWLLEMGVSSIGLTWNNGNVFFSGIGDEQDKGIKELGVEIIELINSYNSWIDLSHSSRKTIRDVIPLAKYPIATHSNIFDLCNHDRNLQKDEILLLQKHHGKIGFTFVPNFIGSPNWKGQLVKQIDYLLNINALDMICFGSDFDGMDDCYYDLQHVTHWKNVIDFLKIHYSEKLIEKILYKNLASFAN